MDQNLFEFIQLDEYNVHSVQWSMESVTLSTESGTLHKKWELVSMDNVDLCTKNEIRYSWIMLTFAWKVKLGIHG